MGIVINTDPKPKFLLVRAHSSGKPVWSWSGVGSQKQHHPRNKEKHESSFATVCSSVLPEGGEGHTSAPQGAGRQQTNYVQPHIASEKES